MPLLQDYCVISRMFQGCKLISDIGYSTIKGGGGGFIKAPGFTRIQSNPAYLFLKHFMKELVLIQYSVLRHAV